MGFFSRMASTVARAAVSRITGGNEASEAKKASPESVKSNDEVLREQSKKAIARDGVRTTGSTPSVKDEQTLKANANYTVKEGDHLWVVAERALKVQGATAPTQEQIGQATNAIVEANKDKLPNPDLIHSGLQLQIPDLYSQVLYAKPRQEMTREEKLDAPAQDEDNWSKTDGSSQKTSDAAASEDKGSSSAKCDEESSSGSTAGANAFYGAIGSAMRAKAAVESVPTVVSTAGKVVADRVGDAAGHVAKAAELAALEGAQKTGEKIGDTVNGAANAYRTYKFFKNIVG